MRDYFFTIILASLIGGIVCAVSDSKFEKPIKYLVSLVCIVLILSPIRQAFIGDEDRDVSLPDVSIDGTAGEEWIITETENMLKKTISEAIYSKFNFFPKKVALNLKVRDGENGEVVVVENVLVYILPEYAPLKDNISAYLETLLFTSSEVLIYDE